jgi:TRAP-type C4-dicarboxylate transport system permease large subunit
MIIYAILTDQPIPDLFMAGWFPGILLVTLFCLYIIIRVKREPSLAPPSPGVSWKEKLHSLYHIWTIVVIILFVMVSLYTGIATPTEIAALGITIAFPGLASR